MPDFAPAESPDVAFRRKVLVGAAIAFALLTFLGTAMRQVVSPMPARFLILNSLTTLLFASTVIFARRGVKLPWLALPLLLGETTLVVHAGFQAGGLNAPAFGILPLIPMCAFCFGGKRLGIFGLVLSIGVTAGILVAEHMGMTEPLLDPTKQSTQRATMYIIAVVAAFLMGAVYESARRRSEQRLVEVSRMASLGTMASGIAHEINNPLTVIAGQAHQLEWIAQNGATDAKEIEALAGRIAAMTSRMAKIVSGLRAYARDAAGEPLMPCSLRDAVEDALSLSRERFTKAAVELRLEPIPAEAMIMARPTQVTQIVLNLLNNAYDAVQAQDERWVSVAAAHAPNRVELRIGDNGPGVPRAMRQKIFTPFFTTKEVGRGTGLGLSICAGLMAQHGGEILLDEKSPHTTFVLRFPLPRPI